MCRKKSHFSFLCDSHSHCGLLMDRRLISLPRFALGARIFISGHDSLLPLTNQVWSLSDVLCSCDAGRVGVHGQHALFKRRVDLIQKCPFCKLVVPPRPSPCEGPAIRPTGVTGLSHELKVELRCTTSFAVEMEMIE